MMPFVDIHCHLVPAIDDGASDWNETLAMARMAVADGIETIVCTPHQLGNFSMNRGETIRAAVTQLQQVLTDHQIPLRVLPGADVRIEPQMIAGLGSGDVVSLADLRRHVLLELPHELYFPLEPVLAQLEAVGMVGILSHPERNQGILGNPSVLEPLVERGCLMQVTAGSLVGTFGPQIQKFSESMIEAGLVHFVSTDAHGIKSRRPKLGRAFDHIAAMTSVQYAELIACTNPAAVAAGGVVQPGKVRVRQGIGGWFRRKRAA